MAEYIDKGRLILCMNDWLLQNAPIKAGDDTTRADTILDAIKMVEDSPAADVVKVVRCKDCYHGALQSNETKTYHCLKHNAMMEGHYFCNLGEHEPPRQKYLICRKCGHGWFGKYNFCSNCGTKLEG